MHATPWRRHIRKEIRTKNAYGPGKHIMVSALSVNKETTPIHVAADDIKCDAGWEASESFCYMKAPEPASHQCAVEFCGNEGGRLPELLTTADANDFHDWWKNTGQAQTYTWLGLNLPDSGSRSNGSAWKWSETDKPVTDHKWYTNKPSDWVTYDCAVHYSKGWWYNKICTTKYTFSCQYDPTKRQIPSGGACGIGYVMNNNICYKVFNRKMTYKENYEACSDVGATMLEFETRDEMERFVSFRQARCDKDGTRFWIGLRSRVDGDRAFPSSWYWPTGAQLDYPSFFTAKPSTDKLNSCTEFETSTANWKNTYHCDSTTPVQAFCQYRPGTGNTGEPCPKCDSGWVHVGNYCYLKEFEKKTFEDSRTHCKSKDATLPIFKTLDEYYSLLNYMWLRPSEDREFWIGLKAVDANNIGDEMKDWQWDDGSILLFPYREDWASAIRIKTTTQQGVYARTASANWFNDHISTKEYEAVCQRQAKKDCAK